MKTLNTKQEFLGKVKLPNPEFGDLKLNVFPIEHDGGYIKLPKQFKDYEDSLNEIIAKIPVQKKTQKNIM